MRSEGAVSFYLGQVFLLFIKAELLQCGRVLESQSNGETRGIFSSLISKTTDILPFKLITHHNKYFLLDTVLENFPNQLTETAEFMCLADTAGYIDISYPPLMRPERKVDVVLHLNYSSGSQTSVRWPLYFLQYWLLSFSPFSPLEL